MLSENFKGLRNAAFLCDTNCSVEFVQFLKMFPNVCKCEEHMCITLGFIAFVRFVTGSVI